MEKKLHIALIGYGKMGKEVEKTALQAGHRLVAKVDQESDWRQEADKMARADVAIEFSIPQAAAGNIEKCFDLHVPVVCGTTGWYDQLPRVLRLCESKNQTLFYAPNFSIGVNVFFDLNRRLALLLEGIQGYSPSLSETHHSSKLDAPSGTAIQLANDILAHRPDLSGWVLNPCEKHPKTLDIQAVRKNDAVATHHIRHTSPTDCLELKHTAFSRSGFSEGALLAALWVYRKKGVYTMKDMLNL